MFNFTKSELSLASIVSCEIKQQGNQAALKAMSVLGMIRKAFGKVSKEIFISLYNTDVRPNLEYCIQAWAPYYQKDIHWRRYREGLPRW